MEFSGVFTALVTPFDKNEKINFKVLKNVLNNQINAGVSGVVCNATTGEGINLTKKEKIKLIKFYLKNIDKKIKVLACVGNMSTSETIAEIKLFNKFDIDGFLLNMPFFNKPNESGLIAHLEKIAKNSQKPIIIYNVPSRSGLKLNENVINKICKIKQIAGIKEASGDLNLIFKSAQNNNFSVLSGCDELFLPSLMLGANGIISVASNIYPKEMVNIYNLFKNKKYNEAKKLFFEIENILKVLFVESNPIPIKFALNCVGEKVGATRLPLGELSLENKCKIRNALSVYKNNK